MKFFPKKACRHFFRPSSSLFSQTLFAFGQFLNTKKSWNRNTVGTCQPKNFLTPRHLAGSFPRCQRGSGNASQSRSIILGQLCFFPEIMQPGSVGVSPCCWFASHATARIIRKSECISFLSKFRQYIKLAIDGNLRNSRIATGLTKRI